MILTKDKIWGSVNQDYIDAVIKYNERDFENVGSFDVNRLKTFVDHIESVTSGEIEFFVMPHSALPDGYKASLLVVKCDIGYFALAGIGRLQPSELFL